MSKNIVNLLPLSINIIAHFTTVSTRSLGMVTPNWMTTDFIIKEPVLGGASIAAVNEQGRDHRGIAWQTS